MKFYVNAAERGDNILLRGYENGKPFSRKIKYSPTLFVPAKEGKWKTLDNQTLDTVEFDTIREAKNFVQTYKDVENFKIYGFERFLYAFLNEEYNGEIDYDPELIRTFYIDIEVASEHGMPSPVSATEEVTAITMHKLGKFHLFSCLDYNNTRDDVVFHKCRDEKELLLTWMHQWSCDGYPDIVSGFATDSFDILYLVNRIINLFSEKIAEQLSPWRILSTRTFNVMGRPQTIVDIAGVASLDFLVLYKKFTLIQHESYTLNNIAHVELGEKKLDYSEYDSLHQLYKHNPQKYLDYNIRDVELVIKLEDKMKFFQMVFALAYDAHVNYNDTFAQVRMWDVIIHNDLHSHGIAIPYSSETNGKEESYEGAYVKDPLMGMHEWVVNLDLDSLYPHLIMQYNISPETMLKKFTKLSMDDMLAKRPLPIIPGYGLAPNGQYFSNAKQGFLPRIMETKYEKRTHFKKLMIEAKKNMESIKTELKSRGINVEDL